MLIIFCALLVASGFSCAKKEQTLSEQLHEMIKQDAASVTLVTTTPVQNDISSSPTSTERITYSSPSLNFSFKHPTSWEATSSSWSYGRELITLEFQGKPLYTIFVEPVASAPTSTLTVDFDGAEDIKSRNQLKNDIFYMRNVSSKKVINEFDTTLSFGYDVPGGEFTRIAKLTAGDSVISVRRSLSYPDSLLPWGNEKRIWVQTTLQKLESGIFDTEIHEQVKDFDQLLDTFTLKNDKPVAETKFYSDRFQSSNRTGYFLYNNQDFGVKLLIPDSMSFLREFSNKKNGYAGVEFRDEYFEPGFFSLDIREEKAFKASQEAEPGDIAYYNWDFFREKYVNKILLKTQKMEPFEKEVSISGFKFLRGFYYNPELDCYVLYYTTYNKSTEIQIEYAFPVTWYENNFSSKPENSRVILADLAVGKINSSSTIQALNFFQEMVEKIVIVP